MRITVCIIVVLLTQLNSIQAQIGKETFEKAVDYVNCTAVEYSLQNSPTHGVTSEFQKKCSCKTNPSYSTIQQAIPKSQSATLDLSGEIEAIKRNDFNSKSSIENTTDLLTNKIFNNEAKYPKLFSFATKRKTHEDFQDFILQLQSDLQTKFFLNSGSSTNATKEDNNQIVVDSSLNSKDEKLQDQESKRGTGWFGGLTFQIDILSIIISIIITCLLIRFLFRHGDDAHTSEETKKYVKRKINESGQFYVSSSDYQRLKARLETLEHELKKMENSKIPFEVVQPKYESNTFKEVKQEEPKPYSEILFLSTPNADGSFNESSASANYREGASIYRFTKTSSNRANFQVEDKEASVKLALQFPDKNIDPVCDAVNAFNPKAKRIVTIESGEVELIGDKWIKNNKAKIRYES
jgi:hypothetical protein